MDYQTIKNDDTLQIASQLYNEIWEKESSDTIERFKKHATYPGFKGFLVYQEMRPVGFVYGYTSKKGQFYNCLLQEALTEEEAGFWLSNCFELVELGVYPFARRKNIASNLVKKIFEGLPHKTFILTTRKTNISAQLLYEKHGFILLKDDFFPGTKHPYLILGKQLKNIG